MIFLLLTSIEVTLASWLSEIVPPISTPVKLDTYTRKAASGKLVELSTTDAREPVAIATRAKNKSTSFFIIV
ncbi:MAG: hypothetical protein IJK49_00655 [Prevotella sp.]|nr:hypothetical protein [Prevotella sp.]